MEKIEELYGSARRTGVMGQEIPTDGVLQQTPEAASQVRCWLGKPQGRRGKLGKPFLQLPLSKAKKAVQVKVLLRIP